MNKEEELFESLKKMMGDTNENINQPIFDRQDGKLGFKIDSEYEPQIKPQASSSNSGNKIPPSNFNFDSYDSDPGHNNDKNISDKKYKFNSLIKKISNKLGEDINKYQPLLRYIYKNENMLSLFKELIEKTSKAQPNQLKNIYQKYKDKM